MPESTFASPIYAVVLLLAGCVAATKWENPRHPGADWDADNYYCHQRAEDRTPPSNGYGGAGVAIVGEVARLESAYSACMAGLGWHQVSTNISTASPTAPQTTPFTLIDVDGGTTFEGAIAGDRGHGHVAISVNGEMLTGTYSTVVEYGQRPRGAAVVTGNSGLAIQCEYAVNEQGHGRGDCSDNHGKKYKLLF